MLVLTEKKQGVGWLYLNRPDSLNSLTAEEKIIGGRVEFLEEENSETALMSGKAKFHIYITPPSPLRLLEYVLEYDVSYLSNLMSA